MARAQEEYEDYVDAPQGEAHGELEEQSELEEVEQVD